MTSCNNEALEPLKIAFIGGGTHSAVGYAHYNASRLDGHFELVAGCFSRDKGCNSSSGAAYGVSSKRLYSTWKDLVVSEKGSLDAIVILTPTPDHFPMVLSALEHGYPVICEKALGISSDECKKMEQIRIQNKGFLAVTFNYSGYPMIREMRKLVEDGRLGKLQQIHVEMPQEGYLRVGSTPQEWRRHDGSIPTVSLDLGVHVHHLVDFVTSGKKPLRVIGHQAGYGQFPGLIDNVYCMAEYEDDISMMGWWGKTALGYRNGLRVRICGNKGAAEWYQMEPEVLRLSDNKGARFEIDRGSDSSLLASQHRYNRFKAGHPSGFIEAFANLYEDISFDLRAYKNNKDMNNGDFVYGASDASMGLRFLECIGESTQRKRWFVV